MIKIQINDKSIITSFVNRIENSIKKNKLLLEEKTTLGENLFANGNELQRKIHNLYLVKVDELENEHQIFSNYLIDNFTQIQIDEIINKYFDYDLIIGYKKDKIKHSYWLMEKLDIRVCPYCNRSYTFTINKISKQIRPEFDHFNPKSNYPYLALSFYNLIPSCPICNHTKKTSSININPYIEGFGNNCEFEINKIEDCILSEKYDDWYIFFNNSDNKFNSNIKIFALKELYNKHKDIVTEIVFKARAYNKGTYDSIIHTFSKQNLNEKEMNLLIFGTYTESNEIGLRPLSKLAKDILKQLGIE